MSTSIEVSRYFMLDIISCRRVAFVEELHSHFKLFRRQRIVASSPALAGRPEFATISNLGTVDVLATRLWLDRRVPLKNPSNVLAGFEPTSGATVFDLNALQVRL
jgi:hypothetical protein